MYVLYRTYCTHTRAHARLLHLDSPIERAHGCAQLRSWGFSSPFWVPRGPSEGDARTRHPADRRECPERAAVGTAERSRATQCASRMRAQRKRSRSNAKKRWNRSDLNLQTQLKTQAVHLRVQTLTTASAARPKSNANESAAAVGRAVGDRRVDLKHSNQNSCE